MGCVFDQQLYHYFLLVFLISCLFSLSVFLFFFSTAQILQTLHFCLANPTSSTKIATVIGTVLKENAAVLTKFPDATAHICIPTSSSTSFGANLLTDAHQSLIRDVSILLGTGATTVERYVCAMYFPKANTSPVAYQSSAASIEDSHLETESTMPPPGSAAARARVVSHYFAERSAFLNLFQILFFAAHTYGTSESPFYGALEAPLDHAARAIRSHIGGIGEAWAIMATYFLSAQNICKKKQPSQISTGDDDDIVSDVELEAHREFGYLSLLADQIISEQKKALEILTWVADKHDTELNPQGVHPRFLSICSLSQSIRFCQRQRLCRFVSQVGNAMRESVGHNLSLLLVKLLPTPAIINAIAAAASDRKRFHDLATQALAMPLLNRVELEKLDEEYFVEVRFNFIYYYFLHFFFYFLLFYIFFTKCIEMIADI